MSQRDAPAPAIRRRRPAPRREWCGWWLEHPFGLVAVPGIVDRQYVGHALVCATRFTCVNSPEDPVQARLGLMLVLDIREPYGDGPRYIAIINRGLNNRARMLALE